MRDSLEPTAPAAAAPARRPWRPTVLIRGSAALHIAAAGLTLAARPLWPVALSAVIADHLLLASVGLWPRSRALGPNWTRLPPAPQAPPAVALTIDDGPDPEVTPRVLALLEEQGARASFFCIGERVERYPALARDIVRRGHTLENHSHRHLHRFALLGPAALAREIARAQQAIAAATGEAAQFFRAPAGLRSLFLEPVLARTGLALVSWTRRGFDTVSRSPQRVLERLTLGLGADDILLLHDGHAAPGPRGPVIHEVLPPLLRALAAAGLTSITLRAAAARQRAQGLP